MATSTIAANAIKGSTTMLSLSSLWRARAHGSFSSLVTRSSRITQSKFPIFSISLSPSRERRRISSPFSSFCTASTDEAVAESVATTSGDASGNNEINVKDAAGLLDIRVGRILRAWKHEEADSLYVEEVDIGEPEPRIICSGLVKYIPLDHLEPRNMRGVKSSGMLMAASDAKHENVELLFPPEEAAPGERIWFGSEDEKENQPAPATPNQIQKKKTWESVQPHLKTDASCIAMLGEHVMRTSAGAVACQSLQNANIS
ncbi:aminoacyl tRNA synthase complex-interacting multifunctional protein 1 isoform X2 [Neltuma alba]|uniref:aminoacyl tRNA synthase complex-interacting multifunctional protein 1 isoform X2 n=1 Tax=Neltuma alba TaxID=207710 RepID=UPI0010A49D12|nr:aminoacyl tRNA synthase complex-interacting multifunctional protein 1-like isoform X2 [Prosopis alba]